jgi:hypothetical protein
MGTAVFTPPKGQQSRNSNVPVPDGFGVVIQPCPVFDRNARSFGNRPHDLDHAALPQAQKFKKMHRETFTVY